MKPTTLRWPVLGGVLLAVLGSACAAGAGSSAGSSALPARAAIVRRLEARLEADPNRALCQQLTGAFAAGDHDAMRPLFDFGSFVERIIAQGSLPAGLVAGLRANPSGPANFARFLFPQGSRFRCLGTRTFRGEPHIAIRQWTDTRYDYVLIRLTGRPSRPIDDYHVVSSGYLHSEAQLSGLDPQLAQATATIGAMFDQSFRDDFAGIVEAHRGLPQAVQDSPVAFFHYLNAVLSAEPTGSDLYREALRRMEVVLRGRDYALAYWHLIDARRRQDPTAVQRALGRLVELLDDYELLEP